MPPVETHTMTWHPERLRWVCPTCGRELTGDLALARVGDPYAAHVWAPAPAPAPRNAAPWAHEVVTQRRLGAIFQRWKSGALPLEAAQRFAYAVRTETNPEGE